MPIPRCILALDQGTTSSRAIVFDHDGRILGLAQQEFPQYFPQPGWVEHDPEDIWRSQAAMAVEALGRAGASQADVAAVGIANQRETTLLWDRATGKPLHRAIVWQDRRTADLCATLRQGGQSETFRQRTGLVLDPYFSGTKLAWLLDHLPGARARAEGGELCFGTVDSWLAWRLTGGQVHVTDATNASRTLLYDLHADAWDEELLARLGIPPALLPEVTDSSQVVGTITALPELAGLPLAALVGDQQAALAGQACFAPGLAKNTYGTGCFLLMHTGDQPAESKHGLLTTVAARCGHRLTYALEGSVFTGGAVVQWLRDGLGIIKAASEIEALAASVPDSGGVVLVPAFTGLGAPYWDPHARGTILGLTRGTTAAHLARAALESITFQVADLVDAVEADAGRPLAELRVDGGAAADDLLLQIQADLLQKPVVRPAVTETTALGAAYFAGLAVGFWSSPEEIASHWQADRRFLPWLSAAEATARRQRWQEAVGRSRGWAA
ncbi:MAG TPA: glycerol kinase GlpK [Rhodocyclaceae bacterium]|nr:glycerol kinase GlpK [Rhodocyclaceae bacterium]